MHKIFVFFFISIFFTGCLSLSVPEKKIRFDTVDNMKEIEGVYKNKGFPRGFYLSELLWRWILKNQEHERIEQIKIETDGSGLIVKGIRKGSVYFEKKYIKGKDFNIIDGLIHLQAFKLKRRPHDLSFGPSYQQEIFGLDIEGNIKYESKIYGFVFFRSFIPVAAADFAEERFEKLLNKEVY